MENITMIRKRTGMVICYLFILVGILLATGTLTVHAEDRTPINVKVEFTIEDKEVPSTGIIENSSEYLKAVYTTKLVAADGTEASQKIIDDSGAHLVSDYKEIRNPLTFSGLETDAYDFDYAIVGLLNQYTIQCTKELPTGYYLNYWYERTPDTPINGTDFKANKPAFTYNTNTTVPDTTKQTALISKTETYIQDCLSYWLPSTVSGHDAVFGTKTASYGSWLIFTAARAGYSPNKDFNAECYTAFEQRYKDSGKVDSNGKPLNEGFDANEVAKDALAITAIGYDARNVAGYNLIEMLTNGKNPSNGYFVKQVTEFAVDSYNYLPGQEEAYIHDLAAKAKAGSVTHSDPLIDMYVMEFQPLAAYYDSQAKDGDKYYDVKQAMDQVLIPYFSKHQGYTGLFYSGISYNNPWSNAQSFITMGMGNVNIFQPDFIKNGYTFLDILPAKTESFSADQGQIARGYEALVRSYKGEKQIFDCTDVTNSTVKVYNAILALPAVDTINADTKAATLEALKKVDDVLADPSLKLTQSQKDSIDMSSYNAVKTKVEGLDNEAAQKVDVLIAALPAVADLKSENKTAVDEASQAYAKLTATQQGLVKNADTLKKAEARIIELVKADQDAAAAVVDLITKLPAKEQLTLSNQGAVATARSQYQALSAIQQALVSNYNTLLEDEQTIVAMEKDKSAADKVSTQIAGLPEAAKLVLADKDKVEAAQKNYDALTSDQKKYVDSDNLNKLNAVVAKMAEIVIAATDQDKADAVMATITKLPATITLGDKAAVTTAQEAYDGLTAAQQKLVTNIEKLTNAKNKITELESQAEADQQAAQAVTQKINELGTITLDKADTVVAARAAFTALTPAQQALVSSETQKILSDAEAEISRLTTLAKDQEAAKAVIGTITKLPAADKLTLSDKNAVNEAKKAYEALTPNQQKLVTNSDTLTQAETVIAKLEKAEADQATVKNVIDQIGKLPNESALKLEDKDTVAAARTAYGKLTETQQKLVTNIETLKTAETKIAKLVAEAAIAADKAAAQNVTDQIALLPAADKLVLADKANVAAARSAYAALTKSQQALVTNLSTLTAAEAKIASLEPAPTPTPTPTPEPGSAKDDVTGVEVIGLPTGTGLKVIGEEQDQQKTVEAEKAAEAAGITNAKVVSLYDIKPDISADELAKFNADPTTYVTINLPLNSDQQGYDNYMVYHKTEAGTVEWITPTLSADGKTLTFKVNAFSEFGVVGGKTETKTVNCSYQTQIENIGWQEAKTNGETSGTSQQSLRLEGIKINLDKAGYDLGVSYQTHVQDIGWQGFRTDGTLSGTENQAKRLEAIQIKLTGADADKFDIYYRVHAQSYGWLGWTKNGASAGTEGLSLRLEAIEIKVVAKDAAAPGSTDQSFVTGNINCSYQTQIENIGWQDVKTNGDLSGTTGQALRLEGIKINLDNAGYDVGLSYQTHVQDIGWQDLKTTGTMSGTEGQSKRLEAIRISLTGTDAELCDIYYQVHAENIGWMGWAKNGESAGTEGFAYRLEGIRIMVVPKGSAAPGTTDQPFVSNK